MDNHGLVGGGELWRGADETGRIRVSAVSEQAGRWRTTFSRNLPPNGCTAFMHEYSLVQSLLAQIESLRRQQRADRVVSVHVCVGEFAGVELELFRDAFELQTTEAWDQRVELTMDLVPLEAECQRCKRVFHVEDFRFRCAHCHASEITIRRGEDLILDTVTFEQISQQSEQQLHEQSS